jgi:hypothetical protein
VCGRLLCFSEGRNKKRLGKPAYARLTGEAANA